MLAVRPFALAAVLSFRYTVISVAPLSRMNCTCLSKSSGLSEKMWTWTISGSVVSPGYPIGFLGHVGVDVLLELVVDDGVNAGFGGELVFFDLLREGFTGGGGFFLGGVEVVGVGGSLCFCGGGDDSAGWRCVRWT